MDAIKTAMEGTFTTVQTNAMEIIVTALPTALTIVGTVMVITIGIKVFKRITGNA